MCERSLRRPTLLARALVFGIVLEIAACGAFGTSPSSSSSGGGPSADGFGGDFEAAQGTSCGAWKADRAVLIKSPNAHGGQWSCRACESSDIAGDQVDVWVRPVSPIVGPVEGRVYKLDAWARIESGTVKLGQPFFDETLADGGAASDVNFNTETGLSGDWVHVQDVLPAPGGLRSLIPGLHFIVSTRSCIDFDDFTVTED